VTETLTRRNYGQRLCRCGTLFDARSTTNIYCDRCGPRPAYCAYCGEPAAKSSAGNKRRFTKTCGRDACMAQMLVDLRSAQRNAKWGERRCRLCDNVFVARGRVHAICDTCSPSHRELGWRYHYAVDYGLSWPQYRTMYLDQAGTCKLCPRPARVVDHDHSSGHIRGLLCFGCNLAVGHLENGARLLDKMMAYVNRPPLPFKYRGFRDLDAYDALMKQQRYLCAVCEVMDAEFVDHCHVTGLVRGILCDSCNQLAGAVDRGLEWMIRASNYVGRAAV
jgi:hypothetical protein